MSCLLVLAGLSFLQVELQGKYPPIRSAGELNQLRSLTRERNRDFLIGINDLVVSIKAPSTFKEFSAIRDGVNRSLKKCAVRFHFVEMDSRELMKADVKCLCFEITNPLPLRKSQFEMLVSLREGVSLNRNGQTTVATSWIWTRSTAQMVGDTSLFRIVWQNTPLWKPLGLMSGTELAQAAGAAAREFAEDYAAANQKHDRHSPTKGVGR